MNLKDAVSEFLSLETIAVTGVSRSPNGTGNSIVRRLRETDHEVFAVNPNLDRFDDQPCYQNLSSLPSVPNGVVIVNRPEVTLKICQECEQLGVSWVWMHRSMESLGSSVSDDAVEYCRQNDISVIPGGCPMMFCGKVDFGHKMMRWMLNLTNKLPQEV